jgi:hypothetical protein
MKYSLDGKTFRSIANTPNGEVCRQTVFRYRQNGKVVTADYSGGSIKCGQLLALMQDNGELDMRYHHLNKDDEFMLGRCLSTPELLPDGRIKFREHWQWLNGDLTTGYSEIEEVPSQD